MITYVNNSNATKYSVLFEDATQALVAAQIVAEQENQDLGIEYLKDEDNNPVRDEAGLYIALDPIKTIEKYFYYLPKLINLGDANSADAYKVLHSAGRRYTMLPLDEEPFMVDANKRVITVPREFAANGVAVQGDQLAEVLYFEVDRYFDAKDLDNADIFIQWTNVKGESGLSTPVVVDIESKPNKMIIGWALTNRITERTGNIQFALRFYQWANDAKTQLSFSWATQTATVAIKPTLDFTLSESYLQQIAAEMEAENNALIERIKGSKTHVTDNEDAMPPIYVLNLRDNADVAISPTLDQYGRTVCYVDLVYDAVADKDVYTLKTQAKAPDSGIISYTWSYKSVLPDDDTNSTDVGSEADPSHSVVKIVFEPTEDTEVKEKIYYKATVSEGVTSYRAVDPASLVDGETPRSSGWYEKIATCQVNQVGCFYAVAMNSKAGRNSATKESDICIVPMPIIPTIDTDLVDKATIKEAEGESVTLRVVASNTETNGTNDGTLTYKWSMKNEVEDEFEEIEGQTASSLALSYDAAADPHDIEGYYKVVVYNTKNGQTVEVTSAECRVSYEAEAPVFSFPVSSDQVNIDFNSAVSRRNVKVELQNAWKTKWNISDAIQYQWYKTEDEDTDDEDDNTLIEGATEASFEPTEQGKYFCVVTNVKNGSEASQASKVFYVV